MYSLFCFEPKVEITKFPKSIIHSYIDHAIFMIFVISANHCEMDII